MLEREDQIVARRRPNATGRGSKTLALLEGELAQLQEDVLAHLQEGALVQLGNQALAQ